MLKAAVLVIVLASVIATYLTQSFVAPGIGAVLLFGLLLFEWLRNRTNRTNRTNRDTLRQAEEATHRQREARARGED